MNSETLLARIYTLDTDTPDSGTSPPRHLSAEPPRSHAADRDEAEEFVRLHHAEHPDQAVPLPARLQQIRTQIDETGTYTHTEEELTFGARVAWRNSSRCIGRLYWKSLLVLDRRDATSADEINQHLVEHLHQATNGGRIRPVISIFAPDTPDSRAPRVWNDQLIRYAGYRQDDDSITGDPAYADFTDTVRRLGWQAPGGAWDVLPWVIETDQDKPELFDVPSDAVLEVHLTHPDRPDFADLRLRWHAVPAISNMRLRIGGIDYPLAPFNGWYLGTEIGARNLVDTDRYNLLPVIAEHLGLDTSSETTLWRDRALVELNVAVLHSFNTAGIKISDHHTESRHFLTHLAKEERHGRTVPADWSWIVPPVSGGITPVFHRYYDEADQRPNFYLDDDAKARGKGGCPFGHS
ncbi:nitric oxide synthase oxygenase [Streptomyces sp. SID9913]|uniref:nitric oxide synthase oxygenase n=1 Tax=Streptomyces sp. SID9913 TaxID=2706117 RepID=UPI0013DB0694|nr:nitric oxide synthase oxygenase [Streptomyces sp. SID9913]NED20617.1 nitric oxide synthase oxygenase [Streptomyces sp. SID9913]